MEGYEWVESHPFAWMKVMDAIPINGRPHPHSRGIPEREKGTATEIRRSLGGTAEQLEKERESDGGFQAVKYTGLTGPSNWID